jgi:magnesium-transporting ATPase (P-type)
MEILSVCHTVIAEKSKHSTSSDHLTYNASSPDELALVSAAKFFGYSFKGRDEDNNMIVELKNSQEDLIVGENVRREYQLLNVIEFNSTRKRMSVIVRNKQDDTIHVMCKGADSIIIPLLRRG